MGERELMTLELNKLIDSRYILFRHVASGGMADIYEAQDVILNKPVALKFLKEKYNIPLILLSKGKEGSSAYYKDLTANAAAFLDVPTIETTGAGDTFFACIINYILEHGLTDLNQTQLLEMLNFANAAAAIITTRKGALKVMPEKNEIEALLAKK